MVAYKPDGKFLCAALTYWHTPFGDIAKAIQQRFFPTLPDLPTSLYCKDQFVKVDKTPYYAWSPNPLHVMYFT